MPARAPARITPCPVCPAMFGASDTAGWWRHVVDDHPDTADRLRAAVRASHEAAGRDTDWAIRHYDGVSGGGHGIREVRVPAA